MPLLISLLVSLIGFGPFSAAKGVAFCQQLLEFEAPKKLGPKRNLAPASLRPADIDSKEARRYFFDSNQVLHGPWRSAFHSVYKVVTEYGVGSAFLISDDGLLVTVAHNFPQLKINSQHLETPYGDQLPLKNAEVVWRSQFHDGKENLDLVILRVPELSKKMHLRISSLDPEVGETVGVIGFPFKIDPLDEPTAYAKSVKLSVGRLEDSLDFVYTFPQPDKKLTYDYDAIYKLNALGMSGNSGGPILNTEGQVVGVAFGMSDISHGSRIKDIKLFALSLRALKRAVRAAKNSASID